MNKNPLGWIFVGIALVTISPLLTDNWYQGAGLFYNVQEGTIGRDIPLRVPVIAGVLCILWGAYLKARNSN